MTGAPNNLSFLNQGVLTGLTIQQRNKLFSLAKEISLKKDEVLFQEGDLGDSFYYILEGKINVLKSDGKNVHQIAALGKYDAIGEMLLIETQPRSATAVVDSPVTLLVFSAHEVMAEADIYAVISKNIAKKLAERLRYTNNVTVTSMQKALDEEKKRILLARFSQVVLASLALYTLSLTLLKKLGTWFANPLIMPTILLYIMVIWLIFYVIKTKLPLATFGLTLKNVWPAVKDAIIWSCPVMLLIVVIKWYAITSIPFFYHQPLFSPMEMLPKNGGIHVYLLTVMIFATACPIQEIMARGYLQSSLEEFGYGSATRRSITAILLSNLLFSAFHTDIGPMSFVITTFVAGLFWGWLYSRQKSIIGVSLSHILIGVFALFFVGVNELFMYW